MSTFLSILPIIIALVLYFTGIPIAYALFAAALTYFGFIDTTTVPYLLMQKFITSTQSFPFLAIPFFIMCGSIMNYGGISARLMDFADALTGHLPGGLAQINVLLSMLMGGCSGSANADAAMECKLLVPEMEKRGYGKGFSAAITAASSCVTHIIPPGINLIVYGLIAGASVGQLFAAGYIPGLLMAVTLMIAVAIISKKRGYAPSRPRRATLGEIGRQALKSFWALFFPLGIIMGMRFGIFTPTEAGGVGVLYCLIVGKFVYKGLRKEHFIPILRETISGTATVMLIIVSATVFGYYLNWENIPTMLLNAVSSFASNKFLVLLVMNIVLLIDRHLTARKRVIFRADADVGLVAQQKALVPALVENALEHDEVKLTALELGEQVCRIVDGKKELVVRFFQKADDLRQQDIVADGLRRADAQARLLLPFERTAQLLVLIALADGVDLKRFALRRFSELSAVVGKKAHAVQRFKRLNLFCHGGLRQMQLLRRLAVVHRGAHGQKGLKPLVHVLSPLSITNRNRHILIYNFIIS